MGLDTARRGVGARGTTHRTILSTLAALTLAGCATEAHDALDETSLYALVTTTDGFFFYPPLAPAQSFTGTFDGAALAELSVHLEATDGAGRVSTVATFDQTTSPRLSLLPQFEVYYVGVPAAAYFTDRASSYTFRVLRGDRELGRSDVSSIIFDVLVKNPGLVVGVKTRLEVLPSCTDAACDDGDACNGIERCVEGACAAGAPLECVSTGPCNVARCDATLGCVLEPAPDGVFDGSIATSCGTGVCASTGLTVCANGQVVDTCTLGQGAERDTTCDRVDDDCDGRADEDFVVLGTTCGSGDSASTGEAICRGGQVVDTCVPAPTCADGIFNGDETGVDCGGTCVPCPIACSGAAPGATCTTAGCTAAVAADGVRISATTVVAGQSAAYEACGVAGQRWSFQTSYTNGCYRVTMTSPVGTVLVNNQLQCGTAFYDVMTLTVSGAYSVIITPSSSVTGTANLTLWEVPADVQATGVLGAPRAPSLVATTPGQNAILGFDAIAGDRTSINVARSSGCYRVSLTAPSGASVVSPTLQCGTYFSDLLVLGESGRYSLLLDGNGADVATFTTDLYAVPEDATAPMTLGGESASLALGTPAQNGTITFDATAGQRASFSLARTAGCHRVSLTAPSGAQVVRPTLECGTWFSDLLVLGETGTYVMTVDPNGNDTATYTLTSWVVPADLALTGAIDGAATSLALLTPAQNGSLTFEATAGQRTAFDVTRTAGCFRFSLVAPSGATTVAATLSCGTYFSELVTLGETGTYRVNVDPNGADTATYTARIYGVPEDVRVSTTLGAPALTVPVTTPAQNAYVTFTATAGQRITVSTSRTAGCYRRALTAPSGASVISSALSCGTFTSAALTLGESGTFTYFLDPNGADVPTFTVTLTPL